MPNFDVVYNKEEYLRHMKMIMPPGYSDDNNGFFNKKEADRLISINIISSLYFPDSARYKGAAVDITFYSVETIFSEVLKHHPLDSLTYKEYWDTIGAAYGGIEFYGETIFDFLIGKDVETDADFDDVRPHLQSVVNACLAFADQFKNVEDAYNAVKNLPDDDKIKLIAQPFPLRWPIILKLCGDSSYEDYIDAKIISLGNIGRPDIISFLTALKQRLSQL